MHVGVVMAWESKQRLQSKGNGMARDHLQGSQSNTPLPTTLPTNYKLISWFDTVCVHNHWAPGRVAFRLRLSQLKSESKNKGDALGTINFDWLSLKYFATIQLAYDFATRSLHWRFCPPAIRLPPTDTQKHTDTHTCKVQSLYQFSIRAVVWQ